MTESARLNLIQRAADRLAKPDGVPAPIAEQREAAPPVADRPASLGAPAPPVPAPGSQQAILEAGDTQQQVRLKLGELRSAGMITPDNMASNISNEYRRIKRQILLRARDPNTPSLVENLVMVTSSLPREGKTFTSLNLAISMAAERDMHVLLIDGDPVHPSIAPFFENPGRMGLIDLLSGKSTNVSDVICRCEDIPNLSVIFAGENTPNAPELMASRRMGEVCVDLSTRYPDRMIIIDTPPVLASTEPSMIAMHVHQLLMVVASEQTDRVQLRRALDNVSACRNISLLFNKAPSWHQHGRSSYYYYSEATGAR